MTSHATIPKMHPSIESTAGSSIPSKLKPSFPVSGFLSLLKWSEKLPKVSFIFQPLYNPTTMNMKKTNSMMVVAKSELTNRLR